MYFRPVKIHTRPYKSGSGKLIMRIYIHLSNLILIFFMIGLCLNFCAAPVKEFHKTAKEPVKSDTVKPVVLGNENLIQNHLDKIRGKRIGLLTNAAGVNSQLESSIDVFFNHKDINLAALFSPEHGIRGEAYAGEFVKNTFDTQTGLKINSLYGNQKRSDVKMLANIDIILIDLQDTGIRSYTFIYSMAELLKAAAQFGKQVIVLDRPNPLGGIHIEGNLVEKEYESFVGMYPIPYRYGMTIGELALLFNNEFGVNCKLTIIPMHNWNRDMLWQDTGLHWVPTSPHIPNANSPLFNCISGPLGELHSVSNGVGYTKPFEIIGAPWIDAYELAQALNDLNLAGIYFRPTFFKPYYAKFEGKNCQGVQIHFTNPRKCNLFVTGLYIMQTLIDLYPEKNIFATRDRLGMFNNVMGCAWILNDLLNDIPVKQIQQKWQLDLKQFNQKRKKYLIY